MVTQVASDFLGGGAVGIFPAIEPDSTFPGIGEQVSADTHRQYPGYIGDGDAVRLPTTAAGDIDYFNKLGVSQTGWPITIADISASHTTWLGVNMDLTDNLLYVCTRGATLTNFILSSINSAGTIVNIATVTVTQPNAGIQWNWGATSPGNAGSCNFVRASDGSGNFTMFIAGNPIEYIEEIEFSVTGTLIQDTIRTIRFAQGGEVHYKTPAGNYIGSFDPEPDDDINLISVGIASGTSDETKAIKLALPLTLGISTRTNGGGYPTMWQGRIILVHYTGNLTGPKAYLQSEFNRFTNTLAKSAGVAA